MNEIIFQTLVSTRTGVGASTGKQTEEAFNENFAKVKVYLEALLNIASITVTSEQITQIKVDTSTTPYSLYYTMDPIDTPAGSVTWYDLDNVSFADIQGNPTDNIALATALASKASATDVSALNVTVQSLSNTVSGHTNSIATNTQDIATNTQSISTIRSDMVHLVHSPTTDGTLYLRYNTTHTRIEYSLDNTQWFNIASGAVDFADIAGNPTSNNNLVSYVTNSIQQAIQGITGDFVSITDFNLHVNNRNNPHDVTKAQIGLGNVDNTSDLNKPISLAMQAEIDALWARYPECQVLGNSDYKGLFNTDVQESFTGMLPVTNESISVTAGGTAFCSHVPVRVGSVTITGDNDTYTVDSNNNIVDSNDNIVGTFTYATGLITSTTLELTNATIDYIYILSTMDSSRYFYMQGTHINSGSIYIQDGTSIYRDVNGHIVLSSSPSTNLADVNYTTGVITSTSLQTSANATISYSYPATDRPEDVLYFTSSGFDGETETLNPNATTYATKGYVDTIVGDINTVLSELTTD